MYTVVPRIYYSVARHTFGIIILLSISQSCYYTGTHDGLTQLLADLVSMATIHTHTHTIMGENDKICMYFHIL